MYENKIKVLEILNKDINISQRKIANELGSSVGKVNSLIKELIKEEYITVADSKKGYIYVLTEKAIKELDENIKRNSLKKLNLHYENFQEVKQAVILAAGEKKEFGKPVGFLELEEKTLIERTIHILGENGVEKIIIVTGYESKFYEELASKYDKLYLVKNDRYKWTGTMSSLALAKDLVDGDFILIENDLFFEERAISEVLQNKNRDCVLITNESGSGDEAFVEIRNNFLYKMSKDRHQFNKIDGEMIGICKISLELYKKMLEQFKGNINPYFNYEYCILDVGRSYNIGYIKIPDLVWSEIDTGEHYEKAVNHVFPRLKRKEAEIKIQSIKNLIKNVLGVEENNIGEIKLLGGMTNKNYKVIINNKNYVLRIPGNGTEQMINRLDEKINSTLACDLALDTNLLYFDEVSGIKIAEFIENAETLNGEMAKREENMRLTLEILKKLHNSDLKFNNCFDVYTKIEEYEELLRAANGNNFDDYLEVKEEVIKLKAVMNELGVNLVPCHNDTVPENFVKSGDEKIYLIDWEYSGMNDRMWDLAAHSLECDFSEDDEELLLNIYFGGRVEDKYRKRMLINKICQDFLWSIWTNIKEAKGDDFGSYGIDRYNRCKKNLKLLKVMLNN